MELEGQQGLLALFWGGEHPETDFVAKDKQDAPVFILPCSHEASLTGKIHRFHLLHSDSALWQKGVGCHQDLESITVPFSGPFEFQKMRCRERGCSREGGGEAEFFFFFLL